jgi:hypothetical protein
MIDKIKQNWKQYLIIVLIAVGSYLGYDVTIAPKETPIEIVDSTNAPIFIDTSNFQDL